MKYFTFRKSGIFSVLVAGLLASGVMSAHAGETSAALREQKADERREAAQSVYFYKLQEQLKLPQERAFKLFALIEEHEEVTRPKQQELGKNMKALRDMYEAGTPDEKIVDSTVERILTLRKEVNAHQETLMEKVSTVLTPVERGKFLLVSIAMKRKLHEVMERFNDGPNDDARRSFRERMRDR